MKIREAAGDQWKLLTTNQKRVVAGLAILVVLALVSGWLSTVKLYFELADIRAEKKAAEQDAKDALEKAARIAGEIREREKDLAATEGKRDAKQNEVGKAAGDTNVARADYDRARREPRPNTPSADELCRELAELGYPCN